jgi:hypothetical protein
LERIGFRSVGGEGFAEDAVAGDGSAGSGAALEVVGHLLFHPLELAIGDARIRTRGSPLLVAAGRPELVGFVQERISRLTCAHLNTSRFSDKPKLCYTPK